MLLSGEWRWIPESHGARHGVVLRHRHGRAPPRRDRAEPVRQRRRRRHPVPRAGRDAAARRAGEGLRRAAARVRRAARRSDDATTARRLARRDSASAACWPPAPALLVGAERRFFDDDPLAREPETQDARGVQEWEIDLFVDLADQPVRPSRRSRPRRARAQRQHHRRGAGFELVHQPHPGAAADRRGGRRAVRSPAAGRRRDLDGASRRSRPASRPGSRCATRAARLWFVSFDAAGHPEAATGAIMVANKIFWALGYWQVENYLVTVAPDQIVMSRDGDVHAAVRAEAPRWRRSDLDDVFQRAHRSADGTLSRRRRPRGAGPSGRRVPLLRHASRRPERRRAARAPPRAARAEGVRRLDQPGGHEGGQHARHRGRRERPQRGAALPAGRRLDVRHRRQRPARVRRRVGAAVRRRR